MATDDATFAPLLVHQGRLAGDPGRRTLGTFTCPNGCGYGFGNVPAAEAGNKASHHVRNCLKRSTVGLPEWMSPLDLSLLQTARWLQRQGFPFDYATEESPPHGLMRALIVAWAEADGETVDNYAHAVEMETGYSLPEVEALRAGGDGTYTVL